MTNYDFSFPIMIPVEGTRDIWTNVEPWFYWHDDIRKVIRINVGTETDLATVPRILRSFFQKSDRRTWGPSIEHDHRYRNEIGSRLGADNAFFKGLIFNGFDWKIATIAWILLRLFGGKNFKKIR